MAQTRGGFSARLRRQSVLRSKPCVGSSPDRMMNVPLSFSRGQDGRQEVSGMGCGAGMISDAAVGRKPTSSFLGGMTENCRPLT